MDNRCPNVGVSGNRARKARGGGSSGQGEQEGEAGNSEGGEEGRVTGDWRADIALLVGACQWASPRFERGGGVDGVTDLLLSARHLLLLLR